MSTIGTIYNIQHFSIHDGPGIRTTVFLKGCPMTCWWCHNPESRDPRIEQANGKVIGEIYSPQELFNIIKKDLIFYDQSGGGVTFSGGEPLEQATFLEEGLKLCKAGGIHTAIDTAGIVNKANLKRVIPYTDLFLFDLKLMESNEHIKYTDVPNQRILENLRFLSENNCNIIIRIPLIPDITATSSNLDQIIEFLNRLSPLPKINLLPYHRIAEGKYNRLGMENKMKGHRELSSQETEESLQRFRQSGYHVTLG